MADREEEQCNMYSTVEKEYATYGKDRVFQAYTDLREKLKSNSDIKKHKDVRKVLFLRMEALRKRGKELDVTGDELERGVPDRSGGLYSGQGSVEDWQDEVSRKTGSHYTGTSYNNSQQSGGKTGSEPFDGSDSSV